MTKKKCRRHKDCPYYEEDCYSDTKCDLKKDIKKGYKVRRINKIYNDEYNF